MVDSSNLAEKIELARSIDSRLAKSGLLHYLASVVINSQPNPRPFGEAAEDWQRELLAPKIAAFEHLAGLRPDYQGPLSFLDILPRGHDKSSLEGRLLSWLLFASRRQIRAYVLAADRDQGRLVTQAMEDEARLNPWLFDYLKFTRTAVSGPAGFVEVIPADTGSAYGLRGNLYVCDEITNWPERGRKMWTAVVSGREKIPGSLLCVLSNAGLLESWQHEIRQTVAADPDWVVFERRGQLASWMDRERVEKLKRIVPPSEAARLYDNEWIDPAAEHDYLRRAEVEACVDPSLVIRLRRDPEVGNYVAAIDYGPKRDRTALAVVHMDKDRRCVVDRLDVWQGSADRPVAIEKVEEWVLNIQKGFRPVLWVVDPYNLEGTLQWMEKQSYPVERFDGRGGASNFELAQHLRSVIVNKQLAWYPAAGQLGRETLVDELVGLRVVRKSYGYRFDHEAQKHDDRAVCVGMAALRAFEFAPTAPVSVRPPVLPPKGDGVPGYTSTFARPSFR